MSLKPPLLSTKTAIPAVRGHTLNRPRLTSSLVEAETPLLLVVAPAGWGKTTLLAQFARDTSRNHPVAWLTLDATDNESHRFWTYLITSLQAAGVSGGESALAALQVPGLDPIDVAIPHLLNDLAAVDHPHTL
jgi:LuxR family maltose regulon positive regulatory protein